MYKEFTAKLGETAEQRVPLKTGRKTLNRPIRIGHFFSQDRIRAMGEFCPLYKFIQ